MAKNPLKSAVKMPKMPKPPSNPEKSESLGAKMLRKRGAPQVIRTTVDMRETPMKRAR